MREPVWSILVPRAMGPRLSGQHAGVNAGPGRTLGVIIGLRERRIGVLLRLSNHLYDRGQLRLGRGKNLLNLIGVVVTAEKLFDRKDFKPTVENFPAGQFAATLPAICERNLMAKHAAANNTFVIFVDAHDQ